MAADGSGLLVRMTSRVLLVVVGVAAVLTFVVWAWATRH